MVLGAPNGKMPGIGDAPMLMGARQVRRSPFKPNSLGVAWALRAQANWIDSISRLFAFARSAQATGIEPLSPVITPADQPDP